MPFGHPAYAYSKDLDTLTPSTWKRQVSHAFIVFSCRSDEVRPRATTSSAETAFPTGPVCRLRCDSVGSSGSVHAIHAPHDSKPETLFGTCFAQHIACRRTTRRCGDPWYGPFTPWAYKNLALDCSLYLGIQEMYHALTLVRVISVI